MYIERKELQVLKDVLKKAINENVGSTILISGDPGTGKSTLIERFMDSCDAEYEVNILTGSGYCFDMDGVSRGFLPWKEVLIELDADKNAGKDQEKKNDFKKIVKTIFDKSGPEWFQNIPAVGEISAAIIETAQAMKKTEAIDINSGKVKELSFKERLKNAFSYSAAAWLGAIPIVGGLAEAIFKTSTKLMENSKEIQLKNQEGFFVLVDEKLRDLAKENPVVVFLDNLQWADVSSLSLLYYLSRKMTDSPYPIVILASFRPQEIKEGRVNDLTGSHERHPFEEKMNNLLRYNAAQLIDLTSFEGNQVKEFINQRFPDNSFDSGFVDDIFNLTKGNPLFVEEILKNFEETNLIHKDDSGRHIHEQIDFYKLPKSVSAIIKERFDRLPKDLKEFLQIASVQGEMFNTEIISSILNETPLDALRKNDKLMNQFQLVEKSNKISESLGDMYQFAHHLVQNYIYNDMSKDFRLNIHKLIADQYKGISNEEVLLQFIFHYGIGNEIIDQRRNFIINRDSFDKEKVSEYLNAQKEVAELYFQAFNSDEALKISSEISQLAGIIGDNSLLVKFLVKQGEIHQLTGKWDEAKDTFRKAVGYSLEVNDKAALKLSSRSLSDILRLRAKALERSGHWNKAEKLYSESIEVAENTGDDKLIANAHKNLSWILVLLGSYTDALKRIKKIIDIYDNMPDLSEKANGLQSVILMLKKYIRVCRDIGEQNGVEIFSGELKKLNDNNK